MYKKVREKLRKKLKSFLDIKEKKTYEQIVEELRKKGCKVGERVYFFDYGSNVIDGQRPWMIEIGNDVQITHGVTILTHGYDWSVLKGLHGEVLGSAGKVKIGNNVFIGINSTILKSTTIGDNVIIGACSVVTKDIPSNSVAVGNPCKVIMSIDEYYERRIKEQYNDASDLVRCYRNAFGKDPTKEALSEFFFLFSNKEEDVVEKWTGQMKNVGNYDLTLKNFKEHKPMFNSMQEFLDSVK